jgi:predicted ATP-grasp superfamily ATP-dependent carboligase
LTSLRALLEGNRAESLEASEELASATFRVPEGIYYLARQFAYLGEQAKALDILSRSISNGFFCYSAMVRDPWLDSLCACEGFVALLRKAQELHLEAMKSFLAAGGDSLLRVSSEDL